MFQALLLSQTDDKKTRAELTTLDALVEELHGGAPPLHPFGGDPGPRGLGAR